MTASENYEAELRRIMDEHDAAEKAARSRRAATYRRTVHTPETDLGPQQQAAAAWAYAEKAGYEVTQVDGADLDRDPRELLGEG